MKKLFQFILVLLALLTVNANAALFVTVRDPANTYVPEYGTNPYFVFAGGGTRFIYFNVRVTNTGTTDEVIYQAFSDLVCIDDTLPIDPDLILNSYVRPNVRTILRPGETCIFTKYSARPFQRLHTEGLPNGFYCINVTVNETVYSYVARFHNYDLYFVTDSHTFSPLTW